MCKMFNLFQNNYPQLSSDESQYLPTECIEFTRAHCDPHTHCLDPDLVGIRVEHNFINYDLGGDKWENRMCIMEKV